MAESGPYGVLAEFETPEALIDAVRRTRAEGYRAIDAFTPFPVEGLAELLEFRDRRVLWLGFIGACVGFVVALAMQMYTNFDYPIDVGGRPLYALSAFAVITFELTILFSALMAALGMLYLNGLPRLHYPVFSASRFHLASRDRFFLCIKADDPRFDKDASEDFLRRVGASSVELIPA
jgi:Protein of unknown function (DUF3341)